MICGARLRGRGKGGAFCRRHAVKGRRRCSKHGGDPRKWNHAAFREGGGYNSLNINGDEGSKWFDPCWPADEMADELSELEERAKADVTINVVVHHYHHF